MSQTTRPITAELEELILWFTECEAIPVQTRDDFVRHLLEVDTIDEKAYQWMTDQAIQMLDQGVELDEDLAKQWEELQAEMEFESNPDTSLQQEVARGTISEMDELVDTYINQSKERSIEFNTTQESKEQDSDQAQIEAIKANL